MNETAQKQELTFDTSKWYAIFSGFLIFPAIFLLLTLLGAIIMFFFSNPSELSGFDLFIYYTDVVTIPYIIIIYILWFMRKQILPIFIIIYFLFTAAVNVIYFVNGYQLDPVNLAMSIVWIVYFFKSNRVKATFVK